MPIPQPQAPTMLNYSLDRDKRNCHGSCKVLDGHGPVHLFIGQLEDFFELLRDLAEDADEARRECH
jgi:hypothetical protein